jgi:hypothetical protein
MAELRGSAAASWVVLFGDLVMLDAASPCGAKLCGAKLCGANMPAAGDDRKTGGERAG